MKKENKWIQKAINPKNRGKLHKSLGIAKDKTIPMERLEKAIHSKNLTLRKEANLAKTLRKLNK